MTRLIVDANLIFSGILNTEGKIADILLNSTDKLTFIAPNFLRHEVKKYHWKIAKLSKLTIFEVEEIEYQLFKNITFITEALIPNEFWTKAFALTNGIDVKDTPYVAYGLFFDCKIWTGDKKLQKGLIQKGYNKLILTDELHKFLKNT